MIGTQTAQVRRDHEARLVHQAKAGNQDALTELLETHYAAMLSLAIRYTKDPDRARDVLHESCLKVITNLDTFRGESRFAGWMARIVINSANLHYRNVKRFAPVSTDQAPEQLCPVPNPEQAALDRQLLGQTIAQLRVGRDGDENLFWRRFVVGQPLRVISQELGISEPSIKIRVHRARARLKHSMRRESAI